jgi:hypothetical protein
MVVLGCLVFLCLLLASALGGRRPPSPGPERWGGARRGARALVRIVVADRGGGVQRDAELLAERFALAGAAPEIVRHPALAAPRRPAAVQVFVEHVQTPRFDEVYPAAKHFLLVNPEFVYDWDFSALRSGKARALCKTRAGLAALEAAGLAGELLAFGGRPEPGPAAPAPQAPGELVLHLAGPSPLKGTLALLRAWAALGAERGAAQLFVACRGAANAAALEFWASLGPKPATFALPGAAGGLRGLEVEAAAGALLCRRELPESAAAALRRAAAIHACPSAAEGWGHILDRARWRGAVIVTLDAPPMNELVDSESAVLAPAVDGGPVQALLPPAWRRFYPAGVPGPRAALPAPGALEAALLRALRMGPEERARLGAAARARAESAALEADAAVRRLWAAAAPPGR